MELIPKTYLCIKCKRRFRSDEAKFIYKRSCMCEDCVKSFRMYCDKAAHYAAPNMEYYAPAFVYTKEFRKLFLAFKFHGYKAYGHLLAMATAEHLKKSPNFDNFDYIIPVPISKTRRTERGFNQSELMVPYVSDVINTPILDCIVKIKNTKPQSRFKRVRERSKNIRGVYECNYTFNGERLILFDDVFTSGSTMYECAKVLKSCGAGEIVGISCAHSCEAIR